jgi:hypothetical protein
MVINPTLRTVHPVQPIYQLSTARWETGTLAQVLSCYVIGGPFDYSALDSAPTSCLLAYLEVASL